MSFTLAMYLKRQREKRDEEDRRRRAAMGDGVSPSTPIYYDTTTRDSTCDTGSSSYSSDSGSCDSGGGSSD